MPLPPSLLTEHSAHYNRFSSHSFTHWIGYKAHITESCDDDTPNLITHVATTPATTADCDLTASIHADLAAKNLLPSQHYLDIGYIDAELLVSSQTDHDVRLVGPVISDPARQARTPNGITIAQFGLDWEAQQAHLSRRQTESLLDCCTGCARERHAGHSVS